MIIWLFGSIVINMFLIAFLAHALGFLQALVSRFVLRVSWIADLFGILLGCIGAWKLASWYYAPPADFDSTSRAFYSLFEGIFVWGWILFGSTIQIMSIAYWRKILGVESK